MSPSCCISSSGRVPCARIRDQNGLVAFIKDASSIAGYRCLTMEDSASHTWACVSAAVQSTSQNKLLYCSVFLALMANFGLSTPAAIALRQAGQSLTVEEHDGQGQCPQLRQRNGMAGPP